MRPQRACRTARHHCLNTPGTIDADYRGEIQVLLINLGQETFTIRHGDRIAQLILAPVARIQWQQRKNSTDRSGTGVWTH